MKRTRESGQVLPLIAVCLTAIMGFAGMSVDVGYLEYHQRQQQSATDAAALGGAQQLIYSGCPDQSAAQSTAYKDSTNNGFTNGANNVAITVTNPPASGPYAGNSCAVSVQVTASKVPTFFTRLFGLTGAESTQAVGLVTANGNPPGCLYLQSPTVSSTFNGDTVTAPGCGILINDTAIFNGDPKFDAAGIGYGGGTPIENGTTFTAATPAPMLKVADPCPEITGCAYIAANPPPTTGCTSYTKSGITNLTVTPGCYSSFTLNGDTNVTFAPGTYVFTGSTIFNGVNSLTGNGVTLYVPSGGTPPTFNGITNLTLSPPTSGSYAGVLYYQVPGNTNSPIFNGTAMKLSGLIYAPGATNVIFNGTNGGYLVVVVGAATFNGSAAYDLATPPPGGSLIKQAVLAQ
jgi:Putative Flp pilus-assembly TadE/G-like